MGTFRLVVSITANEIKRLTQFDVCSAVLYSTLDEAIYTKQPEGYSDGTNRVCRLKRSLIGSQTRFFEEFLSELRFKTSETSPFLYIRDKNRKKLIVCLYIDDELVAATDLQESEKFIKYLKSRFKITTKPARNFLGLEIHYFEDGSIKIKQQAHAKGIRLQKFGMENCKPVFTTMLKEHISEKGEEKSETFTY